MRWLRRSGRTCAAQASCAAHTVAWHGTRSGCDSGVLCLQLRLLTSRSVAPGSGGRPAGGTTQQLSRLAAALSHRRLPARASRFGHSTAARWQLLHFTLMQLPSFTCCCSDLLQPALLPPHPAPPLLLPAAARGVSGACGAAHHLGQSGACGRQRRSCWQLWRSGGAEPGLLLCLEQQDGG